jgi:hypothetical protein
MDSPQQAIIAVAVMSPVALGLYIYGRWRRGELRLGRDSLLVASTVAWALVLAAAFAGPLAATLLVPPVGLLVGGTYLWVAGPKSRFERIGAILAIALGSMGLVIGVVRLAME